MNSEKFDVAASMARAEAAQPSDEDMAPYEAASGEICKQ